MAIAECTTPILGADALIPSQSSETLDSRQLKVRDFRPYKRLLQGSEPTPMPSLHLQGRWLERAGFAIGANVRVQITPRRLIVEVVEVDPDETRFRASRCRRAREESRGVD